MVRPTRLAALVAILPALLTAQEPTMHTVVRGNTLWAIAGHYVGDPFQWPRIHDANRRLIGDPDWILPGWQVVIPGSASTAGAQVQAGGTGAGGASGDSALQGAGGEPSGSGSNPDAAAPGAPPGAQIPQEPPRTVFFRERPLDVGGITAPAPMWDVPPDQFYSAPWLIPPATVPESSGVVESLERAGDVLSPRTTVRVFDHVRVSVIGSGALPAVGSRLQTMRLTREILDLGQVVLPTGILVVQEVTPTGVVAVVESQFDRIALGDVVRPLPAYTPEPAGSTVPATGGAEATVLAYETDRAVQTLGDHAFLDAGAGQGVRIGDEYVVSDEAGGARPSARLKVVAVLESVATARIVELENPVFPPGVRLRPDRRAR